MTLPWLVRLRWLLIAGQLVLFPVARWTFDLSIAWWALAVAIAAAAISNVAIERLYRRRATTSASLMGSVLVLDTALLTLLLAASGGPMNPFTVFFLVYVTLSAIALSRQWTITIAILSLGGFALLFVLDDGAATHLHGGTAGFRHHLQSMWVAYALAAILVTFFIGQITRAIAVQRDQIAALREANARNARLAALTTLAAGAAHELGSPLATIAVAAHEAVLRARKAIDSASIAADLELIELEVDRCQAILHRMAARASVASAPVQLTAPQLGASVRAALGAARAARVELEITDDGRALALPEEQTVQTIAALIDNSLDASKDEPVRVTVTNNADTLRIVIEDRGPGIPEHVLARVGEPFFTTKQPGAGMGLGVFLARTFAESRGGDLEIDSAPGRGTRATLRVPTGPA